MAHRDREARALSSSYKHHFAQGEKRATLIAVDNALARKYDRLRDCIAQCQSALVAFSGGVDSSLLLKVTIDVLGEQCHAITCVSVTMAQSESRDAQAIATELGAHTRHHVIDSYEIERDNFADNPRERCALCKTELMTLAKPLAQRLNLREILLGTNLDDLGDFRPGIAAAREYGARSPFVEAQLSKKDVRALSRALGLRTWNKPQLACLSSRFPYGTQITPDRLRRIDKFEDRLRALGFRQLRVRFHDTIARIEVDRDDLTRAIAMSDTLVGIGRELGFTYVTLDLAGFRTGSLNAAPLVELRRRSHQ